MLRLRDPRSTRRDWAERIISKCDPAQAEIVARLVAKLDQGFEIEAKAPTPGGPGPHSAWTGGRAEKPGG